MNVSNVNQLFNEKIQEINSRLPAETNVNNKFQAILEQAQLKTSNTSNVEKVQETQTTTTSDTDDVNNLLKTMLTTQALLNSTSSNLFGDSSSSSSIFPTSTFNNSISTLQQTQLLNALNKKSSSN